MSSKFPTERPGKDFLREDGSFAPANTQKPVKIGGTAAGPDLSLRSGYTGITEAARLQSRERGRLSFRRMTAIGTAVVGAAAGIALTTTDGDGEKGPKPAPVITELETVGTTIPIVDEQGEGVESLVAEEANASGVQIDWATTQSLVEKARELNEGEPRLGEPYIIPDIPNAEPTSPVAPTPAP